MASGPVGVFVPRRPHVAPSDSGNCVSGFASGGSGTWSGFETAAANECHISSYQKVLMRCVFVCFLSRYEGGAVLFTTNAELILYMYVSFLVR